MEELEESMTGDKFNATLDFKDTYYQVLLDEESWDLTTFTEGINLYRFNLVELSCSASEFTRQLLKVLIRCFTETALD